MNPVQNVWHQLVQRRLLPVAILLVAALAAIPFVLKKDAKPVNVPVASSGEAAAAPPQPVVQLAEDGDQTKRRRVLGARKNPFEPATAATPTPTATAPTATTASHTSSSPTAGGTTLESSGSAPKVPSVPSPGGATGGSPSTPVSAPPVGQAPAATPKPHYELYSLTVRFGDPSADSLEKNLARLKPLPSTQHPILIYLGPGAGAKTALFMVDAGVDAWGDGTCDPSPADCQTIALREGETEFFNAKDPESGNSGAQYQLDVLKIHKTTTTNAKKAAAAKARVSEKGRQIVRARIAGDGPLRYRYDKRSGRLEKLSPKAYKAVVAKAARAARAHF